MQLKKEYFVIYMLEYSVEFLFDFKKLYYCIFMTWSHLFWNCLKFNDYGLHSYSQIF